MSEQEEMQRWYLEMEKAITAVPDESQRRTLAIAFTGYTRAFSKKLAMILERARSGG